MNSIHTLRGLLFMTTRHPDPRETLPETCLMSRLDPQLCQDLTPNLYSTHGWCHLRRDVSVRRPLTQRFLQLVRRNTSAKIIPSRTVRLMSLTACTPPKLLEFPVTVSLTGSSATPCSAADTLTSACPREPGSRRRLTRHHRQAFNFALSKRVSSSTATHHV
jgi:hypothetical protein